MVFIVRQCFAVPHNSKCIVGLRLGLLGLYKAAALIATEGFAVKLDFRGDFGDVSGQGGLATSMGLQIRADPRPC